VNTMMTFFEHHVKTMYNTIFNTIFNTMSKPCTTTREICVLNTTLFRVFGFSRVCV